MIIAIDHGFGLIKTVHTSFPVNITPWGKVAPPLLTRVLEYDGEYYAIGSERQSVSKDNKTDNPTYYLLTLAAIAEEIKKTKDKVTGQTVNVTLAAGLPLTRFSEEKTKFKQYLMQRSEISFKYEGIYYKVKINDCYLFPQGYAGIVPNIDKIVNGSPEVLLVDIGSWTIDILPLVNQIPEMSECLSLPKGVIKCISSIQETVRRKTAHTVSELTIQAIMQNKPTKIKDDVKEMIEEGIRNYSAGVMTTLSERYDLFNTPLILCGGGSCCIANYGKYDKEMTTIIPDIAINAKGYEYLAKKAIEQKKKAAAK